LFNQTYCIMRIIGSRMHGYFDYLMAIALIISPFIFGFWLGGHIAGWIPILLGIALIIYSLMTDYEVAMNRSIPLKVHLMLDVVGGLFLALSPWIFGFASFVFLPHLILGILKAGAGLMTKTTPDYKRIFNF
jgi:hypothetical protein